ncbi:MAG TPA: choice-of-anchor X domain-containing protein, partial [Candidatus Binataceae bacterium]|nr:choice-of-anchor X domain-containing protein [Candidatus Binataceae bacterium]
LEVAYSLESGDGTRWHSGWSDPFYSTDGDKTVVVVFRTNDGGRTWKIDRILKKPKDIGSHSRFRPNEMWNPREVTTFTGKERWVLVASAGLLATTDNGESWENITPGAIPARKLEVRAQAAKPIECLVGGYSSPSPPKISSTQIPLEIWQDEDAQILATSQIPTDSKMVPGGATLIRVDHDGNEIETVGRLYDDGTHGDITAGDGTYTGQFTLNESKPGEIFFAVRVKYRGNPACRQSEINDPPVMVAGPRPILGEAEAEFNVWKEGEKLYRNELRKVWWGRARLDLMKFLLAKPNVAAVGVSESSFGHLVSIAFTGGDRQILETGETADRMISPGKCGIR